MYSRHSVLPDKVDHVELIQVNYYLSTVLLNIPILPNVNVKH